VPAGDWAETEGGGPEAVGREIMLVAERHVTPDGHVTRGKSETVVRPLVVDWVRPPTKP
jgi:hypothetical protein